MSTELTLQEAALAWAHGKRVQAHGPENDGWGLIRPLGELKGVAIWECGVFASSFPFRFRLAHEPPAKKWRPWTEDEVPVGVKFRQNGCTGWFTATCAGNGEIETLIEGVDEQVSLKELFDNHVHSLDNGKTWLPCGVEVSE